MENHRHRACTISTSCLRDRNIVIVGTSISQLDPKGLNSIIHRVFKHRVDEEDRRSEWRNVFSWKFHEHPRFPSTDRCFRSDRVVNQDVDSWTPSLILDIYINLTSLYQSCTIRSTIQRFNGPLIPLFWSIAIKSDVFFFDIVAPSQISRHRDSCKPL